MINWRNSQMPVIIDCPTYDIHDPKGDRIGSVQFNTTHPGKVQRIFYNCLNELIKQVTETPNQFESPIEEVFDPITDNLIRDYIESGLKKRDKDVLDFYITRR